MLTGESVPIEAGPGLQTYAGALVRCGEATAIVTATGARTKFGHTAELVRTAHVESTQQKTVVRVVRNLAIFNGAVIVLLVGYAHARKMPIGEIIPLVLTAVLASIPVALPATFTLAAALGAVPYAKCMASGQLDVGSYTQAAVEQAMKVQDFVNDREETREAFKTYYGGAETGEEVNPSRLYQIKEELNATGIYLSEEVARFGEVHSNPKQKQSVLDH